MKTLNSILLVIFVLICFSCEKSNETRSSIQYLETVLDGCNKYPNYDGENDTIVVSVADDDMHVFVAINYTCGAPFETQCEIINDTVFMYVIDSCEDIHDCYRRCICYYTFDFLFKYEGELHQKYKILLIDPRKETPQIIGDGCIREKTLAS